MDPQFIAANGAHLKDEDATILGKRFMELKEAGRLTLQQIVDDARPADSPTHRYFEWDDFRAAEAFRQQQGHYYLRSIHVISAPEQPPVRAFHVVTVLAEESEPGGAGIRTWLDLFTIRTEADLMSQVIERALQELKGWQRRYREYKMLQPMADGAVQLAISEVQSILAVKV